MATYRVTIDDGAIRRVMSGPTGIRQHIQRLTTEIAGAAKAQAPVKTGRLRDSIKPSVQGVVGRVTADTPYALAVHEGARPHTITPKTASVLRFPNKAGQIVYTNRVNHPGNKPNRFLYRAMMSRVRR